MLVNVTYPSDINVTPQRRVLVQQQEGSAKESEEVEVIYDKKTDGFKIKEEIKKEANEESGSAPSATATGQERSATRISEVTARRTPPKDSLGKINTASEDQARIHGAGKEKIRRSKRTRGQEYY